MKRNIGLATDVCDIDTSPPTIDQDAVCLPEHAAQQRAIFVECQVLIILLGNIVGRRSDHEVDGVVRELGHRLTALPKNPIHSALGQSLFTSCRGWFSRGRVIETAFIEPG
jgi:hypothetical protein